jgi:lipopolysaccharide biosynthesis glycosyltransferase
MPRSEPVQVVLCGDKNIVWGLAVTVRSLLENSSGPVGVTIIASGLNSKDKKNLQDSWRHRNLDSVKFHTLEWDKVKDFRSTKYCRSKASYARFYIGDVLSQFDECVYLDSDLIIMRDIHTVRSIDLEGKCVAAVQDVSVRIAVDHLALEKARSLISSRLELKNPANYFNAGFFIVDLKAWRRLGAQEKLVACSLDWFDRLRGTLLNTRQMARLAMAYYIL